MLWIVGLVWSRKTIWRVVRLAGRLSVAQVPELLTACADSRILEIDLTDLVSADIAGIDALQRVRANGGILVGTPGYIQLKNTTLRVADPPQAHRQSASADPPSRSGRSANDGRGRRRCLRAARSEDTQLLHEEPQCIGMDAQAFGCVAGSVDPPAAPLQDGLDVQPLHRIEIIRQPGLNRAGRSETHPLIKCSVSPTDAIVARSMTFSSSRILYVVWFVVPVSDLVATSTAVIVITRVRHAGAGTPLDHGRP